MQQAPRVMAPATFNALRKAVAKAPFDNEKQLTLRTALQNGLLSVDQARALLAEFTFSNGKLDALRLMWPLVVDPENGFLFYSDFTFQSEKRTVETILRS